MNFKKIGVALATLGTTIALASCGGGNKSGGEISLWVGNESVNFYKEAVKDFLAQNSNFGYSINVVAADTGTIAGSMVSDNTACGDIITVAHDNIGKLAQRSLIKPLTDEGLLKQMISMDEGACYLGEVALVPYDSPINKTNILFFNTLFDENAACHLALGEGFTNLVKGYENYSKEELHKKGINDSSIHVDFMIGSKDLEIVAHLRDGKKVQIFKEGNWAF